MHSIFRRVAPICVLLCVISTNPSLSRAQEQQRPDGTVLAVPYLLQVGDSIEVLYRFTPEYNQTVNVLPDGSVALQLIGSVHVAGLDLSLAHDAIVSRAAARLRNPDLSIALKDYDRPHFEVMGEVGNPGRYELHGQISAVDAIAMAGGFKVSASQKRVTLVHRTGSEYAEASLIDLKRIKKLNSSIEIPVIHNGDVLVVSTSSFSKVERLVHLGNIGAYYPLP